MEDKVTELAQAARDNQLQALCDTLSSGCHKAGQMCYNGAKRP